MVDTSQDSKPNPTWEEREIHFCFPFVCFFICPLFYFIPNGISIQQVKYAYYPNTHADELFLNEDADLTHVKLYCLFYFIYCVWG